MTTIARALVTIKHFQTNFNKTILEGRYSGVVRNGVETTTGKKANEFESDSRKSIQSALDQIESDFKLRCAINTANHTNTIVVGNREMSISDALTYRTHTLPLLVKLRTRLAAALRSAQSEYQRLEDAHQANIKSAGNDEVKALLEKTDKPSILDIQKQIDELDEKINFFNLEFDALLTEKNPAIQLDV